jgi:hypothetical protein
MSNPIGRGPLINGTKEQKEEIEKLRSAQIVAAKEKRIAKAIEFAKTLLPDKGASLTVNQFRVLYKKWVDPNSALSKRSQILPENKTLSEILEGIFPGRREKARRNFEKSLGFAKRNGSIGFDKRISNIELNIERIYSVVQQIRHDLVEFGIANPGPKPQPLAGQRSTNP